MPPLPASVHGMGSGLAVFVRSSPQRAERIRVSRGDQWYATKLLVRTCVRDVTGLGDGRFQRALDRGQTELGEMADRELGKAQPDRRALVGLRVGRPGPVATF
jgi:hypothetical protein